RDPDIGSAMATVEIDRVSADRHRAGFAGRVEIERSDSLQSEIIQVGTLHVSITHRPVKSVRVENKMEVRVRNADNPGFPRHKFEVHILASHSDGDSFFPENQFVRAESAPAHSKDRSDHDHAEVEI